MEHIMTAIEERKEWLLKHMGRDALEQGTVVTAFRRDEDRRELGKILDSCRWEVILSGSCAAAIHAVERRSAPIIISGRTFPDGEWRDLWNRIRSRPRPPMLILASRLADESLWSEVLNLGGYDLLLKPFRPEEVVRVVHGALLAWQNAQAMDTRRLAISMPAHMAV